MDDKTMLELDPYNLRTTVMPLVDLLNAGPISWADRQAITDAIRETLRAHKSLMAEHRHHNEASKPAAAEIGNGQDYRRARQRMKARHSAIDAKIQGK